MILLVWDDGHGQEGTEEGMVLSQEWSAHINHAYQQAQTRSILCMCNINVIGIQATSIYATWAAFTKDTCPELDLWLQQGEQLIIALDVNENQKDGLVAKAFCACQQLWEVIPSRHRSNAPPTTDNGSTVINNRIWATPSIQKEHGGYMAAGAAIIPHTNHWALWIDVHYHCMYGH